MSNSIRLTLRRKLVLAFCLVMAVVLGALWLTMRHQVSLALQQQSDSLGTALVEQTADSVTELVLANDQLSLNVVLHQLARMDSIAHVAVLNVDNQVIAAAGTPPSPDSDLPVATYTAPITLQEAIAGTVSLTLDQGHAVPALQRTVHYFWGILLLGLLLAAAAALALASHISTPLRAMEEAFTRPGEQPLRFDADRDDEVGSLQRAADVLLQRHRRLRDSLAPPSTEEAGGRDGTRTHAAVLCVKVAQLGTAMELLHATTLARLMNEYHFYLRRAARLHGGTVQGFAGEDVTVTFTGRDGESVVSAAMACGRLYLMLLRQINARHREQGSPTLEFRLGIDQGPAVLAPGGGRRPRDLLLGAAVTGARGAADRGDGGIIVLAPGAAAHLDPGMTSPLRAQEDADGADTEPYMAYIADQRQDDQTPRLQQQCRQILSGPAGAAPDTATSTDDRDASAPDDRGTSG